MKKNAHSLVVSLPVILFVLSLVFFLLSACRKDKQTSNSTSDESYITLKANSQTIEYRGNLLKNASGVRAFKGIASVGTSGIRQLTVTGENGTENIAQFSIKADSVMAGNTYVINSFTTGSAQVKVGGKPYMIFQTPGLSRFFLTVTITQHAGGQISGTFSGKLGHLTSSFEELTITEGTFNSKVAY